MKTLCLLAVALTLLTGAPLHAAAQSGQTYDLLPGLADVPPGMEQVGDGLRSLGEQAATFTNSVLAEQMLAGWGWQENAFRSFTSLPGDPFSFFDVSITRFQDVPGTREAMAYFVSDRLGSFDQFEARSREDIGDEYIVLSGTAGGDPDTTVYTRTGTLLIRVSHRSTVAQPGATVEAVAEAIVQRATRTQTTAGAPAAATYLPRTLPLPHADCFRIDGDGTLDFAGIVARFADVDDAAGRLEALGWRDGAYRQWGCDDPPPGGVGFVDIGVHRFRDAPAATEAAPFFAASRALGTDLRPAQAPALGDVAVALGGTAVNGSEFTLYASAGDLLFRVTGVSPTSTPDGDVAQIMAGLIAGRIIVDLDNAAPSPPSAAPTAPPIPTAPPTPLPTATVTASSRPTPTPEPTPTATLAPTATPRPDPTATAVSTASPRVVQTPTPSAPSPTRVTTGTSGDCTLVELFPGYPGYQGYVTGLEGPGDAACIEDLVQENPGFDRAAEDAANRAAAERIGLAGGPDDWTWENWMAVEAERGLPPTCYSCLIEDETTRPSARAAVEPNDPRLRIGGFGTTTWIASLSPGPTTADFIEDLYGPDEVLRAIVRMYNPGHLNAREVDDGGRAFLDALEEPGALWLDPTFMWQTIRDQGGYVPTLATAPLDDQRFMAEQAAEAICTQLDDDTCEWQRARFEREWNEWYAGLMGRDSVDQDLVEPFGTWLAARWLGEG